ncbi:MAG: hypothetical protein QXE05_04850 [Nitrososphaeria archaeon]
MLKKILSFLILFLFVSITFIPFPKTKAQNDTLMSVDLSGFIPSFTDVLKSSGIYSTTFRAKGTMYQGTYYNVGGIWLNNTVMNLITSPSGFTSDIFSNPLSNSYIYNLSVEVKFYPAQNMGYDTNEWHTLWGIYDITGQPVIEALLDNYANAYHIAFNVRLYNLKTQQYSTFKFISSTLLNSLTYYDIYFVFWFNKTVQIFDYSTGTVNMLYNTKMPNYVVYINPSFLYSTIGYELTFPTQYTKIYNGAIMQVNAQLSVPGITYVYPIISWYHFDEPAGSTTCVDSSPNGFSSPVNSLGTGAAGQYGNGLSMGNLGIYGYTISAWPFHISGANAPVYVYFQGYSPSAVGFNPSSTVTVSLWAYLRTNPGNGFTNLGVTVGYAAFQIAYFSSYGGGISIYTYGGWHAVTDYGIVQYLLNRWAYIILQYTPQRTSLSIYFSSGQLFEKYVISGSPSYNQYTICSSYPYGIVGYADGNGPAPNIIDEFKFLFGNYTYSQIAGPTISLNTGAGAGATQLSGYVTPSNTIYANFNPSVLYLLSSQVQQLTTYLNIQFYGAYNITVAYQPSGAEQLFDLSWTNRAMTINNQLYGNQFVIPLTVTNKYGLFSGQTFTFTYVINTFSTVMYNSTYTATEQRALSVSFQVKVVDTVPVDNSFMYNGTVLPYQVWFSSTAITLPKTVYPLYASINISHPSASSFKWEIGGFLYHMNDYYKSDMNNPRIPYLQQAVDILKGSTYIYARQWFPFNQKLQVGYIALTDQDVANLFNILQAVGTIPSGDILLSYNVITGYNPSTFFVWTVQLSISFGNQSATPSFTVQFTPTTITGGLGDYANVQIYIKSNIMSSFGWELVQPYGSFDTKYISMPDLPKILQANTTYYTRVLLPREKVNSTYVFKVFLTSNYNTYQVVPFRVITNVNTTAVFYVVTDALVVNLEPFQGGYKRPWGYRVISNDTKLRNYYIYVKNPYPFICIDPLDSSGKTYIGYGNDLSGNLRFYLGQGAQNGTYFINVVFYTDNPSDGYITKTLEILISGVTIQSTSTLVNNSNPFANIPSGSTNINSLIPSYSLAQGFIYQALISFSQYSGLPLDIVKMLFGVLLIILPLLLLASAKIYSGGVYLFLSFLMLFVNVVLGFMPTWLLIIASFLIIAMAGNTVISIISARKESD